MVLKKGNEMIEKGENDNNIVLKLDAAQTHVVRDACIARVKKIAASVNSDVTDLILLEELGTLADALLIIGATFALEE